MGLRAATAILAIARSRAVGVSSGDEGEAGEVEG
jgi:hypothetical protein